MPRKTTDGRWLVDIRPYGANGPRIRKKFSTKAEATRFEAYTVNEATNKPWQPEQKDHRTLSELVALWYEHHGQHIKSGKRRLSALNEFSASTGNKQARLVRGVDFVKFRTTRLSSGTKKTTMNTYLLYTKSMFNRLIKLELINYENPLQNIERLKTQEKERDFLSQDEITILLEHLKYRHHDTYITALVCLSTGARWSEAAAIQPPRDVRNGRVRFKNTKSKKIREVPIDSFLEQQLSNWNCTKKAGTLEDHFELALQDTGLKKSPYQSTHILRHSFAAHFIMNGGNLVTLQRILGHADVKTTMIYAHLSPAHLADARTLNPVSMDTLWTHQESHP